MNYIILDLEWNQYSGDPAFSEPGLPFEIIEIGAVKLGDDREMVSEFSRLIRPKVYTRMHSITGRLIHLQMQELQSGDPFIDVYNDFREWCGPDPFFCTWGSQDLTELQRNMRYYELPPLSLGPIAYLDVQKLFAIAFESESKTRRNLEYAIDFLGINKAIPFHRAFSDAYYTALIMKRLPMNVLGHCSYDVFHLPIDRDHEIHTVFDDYYKYISRAFPDKNHALSDREVRSTKCYLCGASTQKQVKWFTTNNRHFIAVNRCDEHGLMKSKVRLRKSEDGRMYVVKTQKFIDNKEMLSLRRKRDHMKYQQGKNDIG